MADIRCSHCGKDNPDFFDVCQFCQSPLKPESMLHIGDEPTKKDTGELEEILPDWLKDARQQGKNEEAEDDAFRSQTKPRIPKEEPPDLLAGLMSQSDSDEDEVPEWLAGINPVAEKESPQPSSKDEEEPSDFFSQFRQVESQQSAPAEDEHAQDDMPTWMGMDEKPSEQNDDLTDWLSQTPAGMDAPPAFEETSGTFSDDNSWLRNLEANDTAGEEQPTEKEPEDLGWLHDLEAASKGTGELSATRQDGGGDFLSSSSDGDLGWLNNLGNTSAPSEEPAPSQSSSSDEDLSWLNNLGGPSTPSNEEPAPSQPASPTDDLSWLDNLGGTSAPSEEPAPLQPSSTEEDLGWLKDFGGIPAEAEEPALSQPASSEEDLDWLNNLGSTSTPSEEPVPSQPSSPENLDWLKDFSGTTEASDEPALSQSPSSSDDDLGWLKEFSGTPAASEEPTQPQPTSSKEDLDWLDNLGGISEPASEESDTSRPSASEEGMDWLSSLGETSEPSTPAFADTSELNGNQGTPTSSKPFRTAPLKDLIGDEAVEDNTPDWLKNAMEEPTMPAPGAVSMDWFSEHDKTADAEPVRSDDQTQEEPASTQPTFDFSTGDSSISSAQDVDALFMEMPDWLSREPEASESSRPEATPESVPADDTLSPVELPSWVQAMRPVDSSIGDTTADAAEQITEREGPLAGFRGVIPSAPIGSSLRPKAFSLKLQITEEQQASAFLLEQIIAGETIAQLHKSVKGVSSQKVLRWVLSGMFLLVLGIVLGFGSQTMNIVGSDKMSNLVSDIPEGAPVLVVVDYEPSFSGELETAAGPLLDQLALSKHSTFEFVAMSPNGSALVELLLFNTKVSQPIEAGGLGYQSEAQYFNLGFLPGGSSGVLGFIENPADDFSKYAAVILLTDNAETGRVWVEQLEFAKPEISSEPLLLVSSAQSAPLLQPYVSSGQVDLMVNGLYDAAKYEYMNNTRPGTARVYWDAFGFGLMVAIIAIILGSLWSVIMRSRERRAVAEQE